LKIPCDSALYVLPCEEEKQVGVISPRRWHPTCHATCHTRFNRVYACQLKNRIPCKFLTWCSILSAESLTGLSGHFVQSFVKDICQLSLGGLSTRWQCVFVFLIPSFAFQTPSENVWSLKRYCLSLRLLTVYFGIRKGNSYSLWLLNLKYYVWIYRQLVLYSISSSDSISGSRHETYIWSPHIQWN
jgi:hypothetical protein